MSGVTGRQGRCHRQSNRITRGDFRSRQDFALRSPHAPRDSYFTPLPSAPPLVPIVPDTSVPSVPPGLVMRPFPI